MTGFLTRVRGSSFLNEALIAGTISERSNNASGCRLRLNSISGRGAKATVSVFGFMAQSSRRGIEGAGGHRDLLDHGTERHGREICETADDDDHADQQSDEERRMRRKCSGRGSQQLLLGQRSRNRQQGYDEDEA